MPSLKAAPGRLILRFPPPAEEMRGGIIIPQTSQQRPEFGEVFDLGDAITPEDEKLRRFFADVKANGERVAVSYMSGVGFFQQNFDPKEYGWLKDFRAYTYRELSAVLVDDKPVEVAHV